MRDQDEFAFGGESLRRRPAHPERSSDEEWADYQFYRDNPKGLHFERWVHRFGCRMWFNAVRDTVTHEFIETYRIGEQPATVLPQHQKDPH